MTKALQLPVALKLQIDIEHRPGRPKPHKAGVRWSDPATGKRPGKSESFVERKDAESWIAAMERAAEHGVSPETANQTLAEYGDSVWEMVTSGLERKTLDPYRAGWKLRVAPTIGPIPLRSLTYGLSDRAVKAWIVDGCSISTIKNTIAPYVRVVEQAKRDGIVELNYARVTGWQEDFKRAEDELDDPRSLALPNWDALCRLADALVARSHNEFVGWGHVVKFAACTAARTGEVSGVRAGDIDPRTWTWTVRRQTTPGPGGLIDKGTKGKRARKVPIIEEIRPLVISRLVSATSADTRLFTGPRGGRVSTTVLRDATHWDEVVTAIGFEHLRRHDLRHTGLTWMADAGVLVHDLMKIAGHGQITTTQRYLH